MKQRERVRYILSSLEQTGENLLDLSDDIWLGIDHNDDDELEAGVVFKRQYNEAMADFVRVAESIRGLISDYTNVQADEEATPVDVDKAEHERIIRELDRSEPHRLDEDFRYKRPFGFVFEGRAVKELQTWRGLYEKVAQVVAQEVGDEFKRVTTDEEFATSRGNRMYDSSPDQMRAPFEVVSGIWAEMNLSANDIRKRIKGLLEYFEYDWEKFTVYLREDRDAE